MTGIGNDIASVKTIDIYRSQSPRFYSKILSPTEQALYRSAFAGLPLEFFVWLLWSIKESAYKCLQRHQPQLVFSPVKIAVTQIIPPSATVNNPNQLLEGIGFNDAECFCSTLFFNEQTLYARSLIYSDAYILSVVHTSPNFGSVHWGVKHTAIQNSENESAMAIGFLIDRLLTLYPRQALNIHKDDSGCPHLFADNALTNRPISLSHHGGYVGYAFV